MEASTECPRHTDPRTTLRKIANESFLVFTKAHLSPRVCRYKERERVDSPSLALGTHFSPPGSHLTGLRVHICKLGQWFHISRLL